MIFIDQGEDVLTRCFFFAGGGHFVWGGFWPEGNFCRRSVLAGGGVLVGGGFCPEGFFPVPIDNNGRYTKY